MANHKSALKRVRQTKVRTERNRARKMTIKTLRKKTLAAVAAADKPAAGQSLSEFSSAVDKAAKKVGTDFGRHYGEADKRMRHLLESADGVIANSQDTLDQLEQFAIDQNLPLPRHKLTALLGTEARPITAPSLDRPSRPYFVMIGTIEARKNHLLLLKIWQHLVQDLGENAPILLLIGQRGWEIDEVAQILDQDRSLQGHVVELGRCSDGRMIGLLSGARALLMPSFAEGFGIPVIEALQSGTPVIASDLGVFREVAGDVPLYLRPDDLTAWMEAILSYSEGSADRQRQASLIAHYAAPNWEDHFRHVDSWLEGLAQNSR
jgi:ribosomal protein S20